MYNLSTHTFTSLSYNFQGCFGDVFNRMKLNSKVVDENEPYSIFGLRCAALRCGSGNKGSASTVVMED